MKKNLNFIINIFLLIDYPLNFIFNAINLRLKTLFNKRTNTPANGVNNNNSDKINWFTISYFPNISEKFKNIIKNLNNLNKLKEIIKVQKVFPIIRRRM